MKPRPLLAAAITGALLLWSSAPPLAAQHVETPASPDKVIGAIDCAECHSSEETVWTMSSHFRSNDLHRDPRTRTRAIEIATRLGLYARDIPTHARCVGCHGTPQRDQAGSLRVIGGVSCESCHGAGLDYVDVHGELDDYPSRERRRDLSASKGLRYPHDIHLLGASCFECHVIADEELVNTGGHPARSPGFNLVSWTQGEVRHNFYDRSMQRRKSLNHSASSERCRQLYVTGLLLDLESSLRALSKGEHRGNQYPYRFAMGVRAHSIIDDELPTLIKALEESGKAPAQLVEISRILDVTDLTGPSPPLLAAAIAIEQKIETLAASRPLYPAGIDVLIPSEVVGEPYDPSRPPASAP